MNCRIANFSMFRVLFLKSFVNQNISKCSKFHDYHVCDVNLVKSFQRCCSSRAQNTDDTLENFAHEFETEYDACSNIDFEAITNNDPEKIRALKVLQTKLDVKNKKGSKLPKKISTLQWKEIINLPSFSQKLNYLKFIAMKEERKEEKKAMKLEKRKLSEELRENKKKLPRPTLTTNSPVAYGLSKTTLFQRLRDSKIDQFYNYKLLDAYMYGPDIVFDCEYTSFMTRKEINSAAFQICGAWQMNRSNLKPFNIVYANLSKGSLLYERIKLMYPALDNDLGYPFVYTPKSFLDLYPREQLIYLSPHAIETMETYESDKVYIIGCMVDLAMPEPLSLAKAKKFNIRTVKFPLNKYLNWKSGGKALNMDHCIKIMLDIKNGYDWQTTLVKHIPSRKLEIAQPDKPKTEKYLLDARAIRRLYLKNKVHELIVEKDHDNNN